MAKIFHSLTDSLTVCAQVLSDLFRGFFPLSPLVFIQKTTGCLATAASWNIQLVYTDINIRTSLWRGSLVTTYFQTKDSNRLQQSWSAFSRLNEQSADQL
jgi:hypothetical protein